jgi:hypothetical protein
MNLKVIRVVCILSLLLTVIWYVNAADAQGYVTDGLVAMYTLDEADVDGEVVMDASDSGNNAKLVGSLGFAEGPVGDALVFTAAADNYVEIPALGGFEFASVECYAFEAAFAGIQGIISTWMWTAGKVHYKFQGNQIQVDKNGGQKIVFAAEANAWYHIIYTTDTAANELKLYVDGELVAEGVAGAQPENMDERRIGSEHNGRYLNGMIDNVRIYDRVLSEEEVMQNFGAKSDQLPVEPAEKLSTTWGALKRKRI